MKENCVAKVLIVIGIVEVISGVIAGCCIAITVDEFRLWGVLLAIMSFINCMVFVGFAEIITLLQQNVNGQNDILAFMRDKEKINSQKTVIQDIENNLPNL